MIEQITVNPINESLFSVDFIKGFRCGAKRQFKADIEEIAKAKFDRPTGWIPVSEKVPEEDEKTYWICTDGGYQCECRWTNVNHFWTELTTDWHWHICDVPQYDKVVAWMPLPEPYKGGDSE